MILPYGAGGVPGRGEIPMSSVSSRTPVDFLLRIENIGDKGHHQKQRDLHPKHARSSLLSGEALIKSVRAVSERFFVQSRYRKRRNTLCISRFRYRRVGGKDPLIAEGDLFRVSLITARRTGRCLSSSATDTAGLKESDSAPQDRPCIRRGPASTPAAPRSPQTAISYSRSCRTGRSSRGRSA